VARKMKCIRCKQRALKSIYRKYNTYEVAGMKEKLSWFDRVMAAVTFAEANEHSVGKEFLTGAAPMPERQKHCKECDAILTSDLQGAEIQS